MRVRRRRFTKQSDSHPRCATCSRAGQLVRRRCPVACCPRPARIRCVPKNACACSLSAPVLLALVQRRTRGPFLNGSSQRRLPRVFAYPALLLTRKRRHDKHRAGCMSHRAFSDTANERSPQTSSTMRRDNDQIGTFPFSRFVNGRWAVSGNGRGIDRNTIEIDASQESKKQKN
jgi:hypothetical protein